MKKVSFCAAVFFATVSFAQNIGIGTNTPAHKLHVHENSTQDVSINLTNSLTGTGANRGTRLRAVDNDFLLTNYQSGGLLQFSTASTLPNLVIDASGRVGVNTATPNPTALLHVNTGGSLTHGLLVTGAIHTSATVPNLGAGSRLMFYPGKAAFRAGYSWGENWDNSNVGLYSFATGVGTKASDWAATAMGNYSVAAGVASTALGNGASAYGYASTAIGENAWAGAEFSTAIGNHTAALGNASIAMGNNTRASGYSSATLGFGTIARGFGATAIGVFNDSLFVGADDFSNPNSPLFIVGNGNSNETRSNAFVVHKDGKVGVGNIAPAYLLDVGNRMRLRSGGDANNSAGIWFNNNTNSSLTGFLGVYNDNLGLYGNNGAGWGLVMNSTSGNVGIGTTTPSQKLSVNGNICYTGSIGACSDVRYKTNFLPVANALSAVMRLHPIYYHWKKEFTDKGFTGERQIGFSAQEIERYFPEMVQTDSQGYKAVDYSRLTTVLVEAVKEQQQEIGELKARLLKLEKRIGTAVRRR